MTKRVNIIGGGLAGCEAAHQLSRRGIDVVLFDIKPKEMTPAHTYSGLGELVCSNSLKATALSNAGGLLKAEMEALGSLVIAAAKKTSVSAGGALAVDRYAFSDYITQTLKECGNVEFVCGEVTDIPTDETTIVAAGPLCTPALCQKIMERTGKEHFHFFDAASPIVTFDSVDMDSAFFASRYDKGESDYLNCPMDKEEYELFYRELVGAQCVELKSFEQNVFEGCMPVEVMGKRGEDTLRFGPLKPVGLYDPRTGKRPYAVVQLRAETNSRELYNLVGFQTNLTFGEQKRVFSLIPALRNAEFVRYGVMHKNTYINAPALLNRYYQLKENTNTYFAGQITGVEGYVESASSGLLCGIFAACDKLHLPYPEFSDKLAIGALPGYIVGASEQHFQPMNINFGIMAPPEVKLKNKIQNREEMAKRALFELNEMIERYEVLKQTRG